MSTATTRADLAALGSRPGVVKVKPNVAPFAGRTGIIDAGNPRTVINGMVRVYFPAKSTGPLVWREPAVDYYHPAAIEHTMSPRTDLDVEEREALRDRLMRDVADLPDARTAPTTWMRHNDPGSPGFNVRTVVRGCAVSVVSVLIREDGRASLVNYTPRSSIGAPVSLPDALAQVADAIEATRRHHRA